MGVYAVTGAASGMGRQAAEKLRAAGHRVIGVDMRDTEVTADLSTPAGRAGAAQAVLDAAEGSLDGAVLAAGLGPTPGRGGVRTLLQVNYFGVVELLGAWRAALAASDGVAKVVVIGSNSTTVTPAVPGLAVRALLASKARRAERVVAVFGPGAPSLAYAASKIAVSRWVRRHAVLPAWAGADIRLNVLAPGAIMTPLLEKQLATPGQAKAVQAFPVPVGHFGDAGQLGDWMMFMLSEPAEFLCGSVIFVDGGSDAFFRADDWPRSVPVRTLIGYGRRFRAFRATR
ncbi:SDR family oxidoreductase [Mycobacterium koreense]|uniref:NAD-dependent epimerase n=1 Tax=Mycolicibacillus koreensis TaxID=1069220 RepID=A0A7I7SHI5_9MYCO|nr:SDR family oxidoreductase [Mycolicibacillus koreensis]MCV7250515.1 SDR family oxidoreductase [Mycolicibacillus koreensis]ODR04811.1 NAD-dependent epimerase [Mycolicibacillus koreensis]OSC32761.1 NAD-dependent epimerase [Mycolicibacillus koreensis]BBY56382.1 NAD-dependent epimerase [Mycolicibacillus koreensis]